MATVTKSGRAASRAVDSLVLLGLTLAIIAETDGNALLLARDNSADGWVPVRQAIRSGRAFAIEVGPEILACDADLEDAAAIVDKLVRMLSSFSLRPVVVASGQPGRLHLFARIADAALMTAMKDQAKSLKLDVRPTIRPPLAPHRLGLVPQLISPADPQQALRRLRRTPRPGPLSPTMQRLLTEGDRSGRYASRSEAVQAIATAAAARAWTEEDVYEALADPDNVGGRRVQEALRDGGESKAREQVRRSWGTAIRYLLSEAEKAPIRPDVAEAISGLRAYADSRPWTGVTGKTDRAVYVAYIGIAERAGKLEFDASQRAVAEKAGVARKTAANASDRLKFAGLLKYVRKGRVESHASRWSLPTDAMGPYFSHPPSSLYGVILAPEHDVWRWKTGLGKTAHRVYSQLRAGEFTEKEISEASACSLRTARRWLGELRTHGLAERLASGEWRLLDRDLDEVAEELASAGAGERQRRRHELDREAYRAQKLAMPASWKDAPTL